MTHATLECVYRVAMLVGWFACLWAAMYLFNVPDGLPWYRVIFGGVCIGACHLIWEKWTLRSLDQEIKELKHDLARAMANHNADLN